MKRRLPSLIRLGFKLTLLAAVTTLCLAAGEVILRVVLPEAERHFVLPPGLRMVFRPVESILPGVSGESVFAVSADGVRGPAARADRDDYRILAIGGSTTECAYLDEPETWTHLVRDALDLTRDGRHVWIGNVGRSGLTSRDHVLETKYLLSEFPRIHSVIVLVGINDLTVALKQGDGYVTPPPITEPEAEWDRARQTFVIVPGTVHKPRSDFFFPEEAPWYKGTAIWQLLKRARLEVQSRLATHLTQDEGGQIYKVWRSHRRESTSRRHDLPDLRAALAEYRRNLHAVVDAAESHSARLILMTQPSLWRDDLSGEEEGLLWLGGVGDFQVEPGLTYFTVPALRRALERFNAVLLEVCSEREVECLDLATRISPTPSNFYDDVHFTEEGARAIAREVAGYMRSHPPFSEVSAESSSGTKHVGSHVP